MRSWSGGLNAAKAQGRDWKAYAKKVTLRWVFKTVSEFAVQKRKEGPSTRGGLETWRLPRKWREAGEKWWEMKLGRQWGRGPGLQERGLGCPL